MRVTEELLHAHLNRVGIVPKPNLAILNRHLQLHGPLTQRLQRFGDFGVDLKDL